MEFSGQNRELKALCDNISTNIYTINSATKSLQGAVAALGTNNDTQGLREQVHVWQLSAKEVVKASTADVATLARLARTCNKPQQLQANKIMGHFNEAVDDYTKVQMVGRFCPWAANRLIGLFQTVVQKLKKTLPRQQSVEEDQELSVEEERQQLLLQQNLRLDVDLIVEREMRVKEIEGDITAINQMMCELAAQVKEQSTAVGRVQLQINFFFLVKLRRFQESIASQKGGSKI